MNEIQLYIFGNMVSVIIALLVDAILGDPEHWPHPVRWFGKWISWLDNRLNKGKNKKAKGFIVVLSMGFWTIGAAGLIVYISYQIHIVLGIIVGAIMISTTIASKSLAQAAGKVAKPLLEKKLEQARKEVGMIVGRDTEALTEKEIVRATVETVAENTSDGITAPLFFAFLGGAPLALFYRAINTCDSMVGYKDERYFEFGYFSAKCDDFLNYVPSRLTAVIMAVSNLQKSEYTLGHILTVIKRDARKHPSPNSGFGESAMAALLGVRLGGVNTYQGVPSYRPTIGESLNELTVYSIERAVRMMKRTVHGFSVFFVVIGGGIIAALAWS